MLGKIVMMEAILMVMVVVQRARLKLIMSVLVLHQRAINVGIQLFKQQLNSVKMVMSQLVMVVMQAVIFKMDMYVLL
jgi:hypothetical protein